MANLVRRKQVDQTEFSGFFVEVGNENYYPLNSNPSNYLTQTNISTTTGIINNNINSLSGYVDSQIATTGFTNKTYTDSISGALDTRLVSSGALLSGNINILSGYVNTVSGNLNTTINSVSGALNTKINTASGVLKDYTNTTSGNLYNQMLAVSNTATVSGIASGDLYNFTGQKIFKSAITTPRINLSGVSTPTSIGIVTSSGSVSIVGSVGTFMSFLESGTTNSLWSVASLAGVPMLELFDDDLLVIGKSTYRSMLISGALGYIILPNLPTSSAGLPTNAVYRDGNTLKIV